MSADAAADPRATLAASVRRLIHATVTVADDAALLRDAAARLDAITATLDAAPPETPLSRYPGGGESPVEWMPYDAVMGKWNPLAAPLEMSCADGRAIGAVSFGTPYEGPPGCVHGGVIAASFDQVSALHRAARAGRRCVHDARTLSRCGADVQRGVRRAHRAPRPRVRAAGRRVSGR